jgi:salicylate hydroxylase
MATAGSAALAEPALHPARAGKTPPILIAGGGIGGLATALALALRGYMSHVLERRAAFAEDGAGIQIGPNGTRILRELGIADTLRTRAGVPQAIVVHGGGAGDVLTRIPLGDWIERRHGAPYWTIHRQDLHAVLLERARSVPLINISTTARVTGFTIDGEAVTAELTGGRTLTGAALIGADGLWSSVRRALAPHVVPRFSGKSAVRAVVDARQSAAALDKDCTHIWLRPGAHIVHYPVRQGREIAIVVILDDTEASEGWSTGVTPSWLGPRIAGFPKDVRDLISAAQTWRKWSLFVDGAPRTWSRGPVTLLGDAAHPVLPFLAQGGVLALEDAVTLAACIDTAPHAIAAMKAYERQRKARAQRVARASLRNGRIYQLDGLAARARDAALKTLPPGRLMASYDWLYGHRAVSDSRV